VWLEYGKIPKVVFIFLNHKMKATNIVATIIALYIMMIIFFSKKRGQNSFIYPVSGFDVSSPFGMRVHPITGELKMHNGVDFACPTGTPVYAVGSGVVYFVGHDDAAGNYVKILHDDVISKYLHMSSISVVYGQNIEQGQLIGYSGSSGAVTGSHLHFALQDAVTLQYFDPLKYLA